jgi:hypothetical protein
MIWHSRDGRDLEPKDFCDDHLMNAIKYIVKHSTTFRAMAEERAELAICQCTGEQAYDEVSQSLDEIISNDNDIQILMQLSIYGELVNEASNRHLIDNEEEERYRGVLEW